MNRLTGTSESCISKLLITWDSDIKSSKLYRPVLVFHGYPWTLLLIHLKRFLDFTTVPVIILGDFNTEVEMKLSILVLRQWVCNRDIGIYGNEIESSHQLAQTPAFLQWYWPLHLNLALVSSFSLKMELLLLLSDDGCSQIGRDLVCKEQHFGKVSSCLQSW